VSTAGAVVGHVRHPRRWLQAVCGGAAAYPLFVLFGLNAVDELDRTAFGILLPEIRDEFNLDLTTTLGLVALVSVGALALQVPIAQLADRHPRVPIMVVGALLWALFAGMTGLATTVVLLGIARSGSAIGKAVIDPTHNSLIADYYPIEARSRVYSVHRAANALGAFVGPLTAGFLAYLYGWRVPFLVFVAPTLVFAVLALRLREPVRGHWERAAAGADDAVIGTEETTPSFAESWRTVQRIPTLRRLWMALPFLAASLIGFVSLASILYDQEFGLDERARGVAAAVSEPFAIVGLVIGARVATRRYLGDPAGMIRFLATMAVAAAVCSGLFALSPNVFVAVALNCVISALLAVIAPGLLTALSLAIPPRARATGFSVASLWIIPGLGILPLIGWISDSWGIRVGMLVMVPAFVVGSLILRSLHGIIGDDIAHVWATAAARSEALHDRRQGRSALLLVRKLEAGYGGVRIVHGVDLHVREGEIVALLGTNGAGKSTLLKSISGVVEADRGAVILDGRDITHAPPNEVAALGVVQLPGGAATFGGLSVEDNLGLAAWTSGLGRREYAEARERVLTMFPVLAERIGQPAANLSGGQQQMLALAMCLLTRPRVLLIDELSLGLAPVVVAQLLPALRALADDGVGIVVVEQSVDLALRVADRAYFLERGEIRFDGPTRDLLERPDLLRSVFLAVASAGSTATNGSSAGSNTGEVILRTTGLGVRFGGLQAVDDVSIELHEGEIVGVIGPNGAGKTTLFDLVSGFTRHTSGRIELLGSEIDHLSPSERARRGLGRSFQSARMFPELTVSENLDVAQARWNPGGGLAATALRLPMAIDAEDAIRRRTDELVELFGLDGHRHLGVRELSTGTRRVVDLAGLVALRPVVVLLDEPSAGIAQREVEALAPLVRRLRDDMGSSLLVIDHDLGFLTSICDRLVALDRGQVIAVGTPAEVLAHPAVVESYLGRPVDLPHDPRDQEHEPEPTPEPPVPWR
jgi:ABC-type branched-subunit amino acid transport system ATPase component/predicted MFS family arabinose efflux permease